MFVSTSWLNAVIRGAEIKPGIPGPGRNSSKKQSNYSSFPMCTVSVQHTQFAEVRE